MVVKVLQVLTVLVKFGYYDDSDDVNELLPAIQKLLNGKGDYPTKKIKRYFQRMGSVQKRKYHYILDQTPSLNSSHPQIASSLVFLVKRSRSGQNNDEDSS